MNKLAESLKKAKDKQQQQEIDTANKSLFSSSESEKEDKEEEKKKEGAEGEENEEEEEIDYRQKVKELVDRAKFKRNVKPEAFAIWSAHEKNMMHIADNGSNPQLYIDNPPKVDYYDVFYFETIVRNMMDEFMEPWRQALKEDKEKAAQLRYDYNSLMERMHELECYAMIQEWKLKPSNQFYEILKINTGYSPKKSALRTNASQSP